MKPGRPPTLVVALIGEVYSNELGPRFLVHRRVLSTAAGFVHFEVVLGRGTGTQGRSREKNFLVWARSRVSA